MIKINPKYIPIFIELLNKEIEKNNKTIIDLEEYGHYLSAIPMLKKLVKDYKKIKRELEKELNA